MVNAREGSCVLCHKLTVKRCFECHDAPIYDDSANSDVFYCCLECQKFDWLQHKAECERLQARKSLVRAALLLHDIFHQIRLHASIIQFDSLRNDGSNIYLDGVFGNGSWDARYLTPFPTTLNTDQRTFEAVLMWGSCTDALMYLHSFAKELLIGNQPLPRMALCVLNVRLLS